MTSDLDASLNETARDHLASKACMDDLREPEIGSEAYRLNWSPVSWDNQRLSVTKRSALPRSTERMLDEVSKATYRLPDGRETVSFFHISGLVSRQEPSILVATLGSVC